MSKPSSPLSREGLAPSMSLSLIDQNPPELVSGCHRAHPHEKTEYCYGTLNKRGKPRLRFPYRVPSPLQRLATELNWDLSQIVGASLQLQRMARKYNLILPKIYLKDVPAADVIATFEKELKERVAVLREKRSKQIKEKQSLDIAPTP